MNTLEFLQELYGTAEEGWLTLTYKRTGPDSPLRSEFYPILELDRIAKRASAIAQQADLWFGVASRKTKLAQGRGGAQDCLAVPGLWLDVDHESPNHKTDEPLPTDLDEAIRFINRYPVEPSLIVATGGGAHAYWLFDEMVPAEDAAGLLARWHLQWQEMADDEGWHLDSTADLARILRLPGSFNRKNGGEVEVKVL